MPTKIGLRSFDPSPMNLFELSEFMFVLQPYADGLIDNLEAGAVDTLHRLVNDIVKRLPEDIFRLLAMSYHVDAQTFLDDKTIKPAELVSALVDGFNENKLPDLIQAGFALGIYDRGLDGLHRDTARGRGS